MANRTPVTNSQANAKTVQRYFQQLLASKTLSPEETAVIAKLEREVTDQRMNLSRIA